MEKFLFGGNERIFSDFSQTSCEKDSRRCIDRRELKTISCRKRRTMGSRMVGKEFFEAVFELVGTDYISLSFLLLSDGLAGHLPPSMTFGAVNCMGYPDGK